MILRVKTKTGRLVINSLSEDSTLESLQKVLEEKTNIPPISQRILCGYPPKQILSSDPQTTLVSLHIKSGETIIFEELAKNKSKNQKVNSPLSESVGARDVIDLTSESTVEDRTVKCKRKQDDGGCSRNSQLTRKIVPADNSCLFKTISILLCKDRETTKELRELVGSIILSDPVKYDTALLGRDNHDYVDWLLREESWGGAIEVSVFSEYYQTELDVVDIQTQRIDKFGESNGYTSRALLLYDGIHYDPLVTEGANGNFAQSVFPTTDDSVLVEAVQIAKEAFQARQFTDLAGFSLRCMVCGKALTGQSDAQSHAKTTGHINFGEV